jgi:hypothetical protein
MRLNFVKFSKKPLKIYRGQKWVVKMNFAQPAPRVHLNPDGLSTTEILDIHMSENGVNKKYFNCVSKLVVSEMNKKV